MFVYKRKKKSINNQTAEYNENDENTAVKDLQRRATFNKCVTERLLLILSVFCRMDRKKIVTPRKDLQRRAISELKNCFSIKECVTTRL